MSHLVRIVGSGGNVFRRSSNLPFRIDGSIALISSNDRLNASPITEGGRVPGVYPAGKGCFSRYSVSGGTMGRSLRATSRFNTSDTLPTALWSTSGAYEEPLPNLCAINFKIDA